MAPVAGVAPQLLKLLETVDKLSQTPGAGLRVPNGPGGEPPKELVRAFEDALQAAPAESASAGSVSGDAVPTGTVSSEAVSAGSVPAGTESAGLSPRVRGIEAPAAATGPTAATGPIASTTAPSPGIPAEAGEAASLLHDLTHGGLTHANLFRLQYVVSMLSMQTTRVNGLSQQASQQVETFLKRQD